MVNIVHGFGEDAGDALVRHPDVPVITFTGSRETGITVAKAAAERLKHVHVELGGKNAIIVLDDADLDLAIDGIVWSAFGTSGQRCTAASRVIVQRGAYDELQKRLVARVEKLRLGPGWEDDSDIGPLINRAALDKVHSYTEIGTVEGAELLTGGEVASDGDLGKGFFYRPTVFGGVDAGMRIANEEIFGPTTALIPVDDFDEALRVANGVGYGLSSSIFTRDVNKALPRDARPRGRHHVHQRRHDRRRGASPVRRHEGDGQRPPRGGPGGARRVHRVEVDLRRLLRQAPARPDRHGATEVMEYRQLGDSDLRVSEICLGTWTTFGGSLADDAAHELVDVAFELGINVFDTANVYSDGRSEEVLGQALASRPRDSYIVATKVFAPAPDGGRGLSREQILTQIDASLARLGMDYVDLYQCHSFDDDVPVEETLGALTEVVDAGKARYIGVSNWSGAQIRNAVDLAREHGFAKIVSSQPEYSLLHRDPEADVIPASRENSVSQIVYSPLAQGVLTGKYAPGATADEGTRAAARSEWMQLYRDEVLERVQRLRPIADGLGLSMAQLALAWILREPNVASAIIGASRPDQLRDNAAASGLELGDETLRAIAAIAAA